MPVFHAANRPLDPSPVRHTMLRMRCAMAAVALGGAAAIAAVAPAALAQPSDRGQPVSIEADRMAYDDRQQTNVFTGNVVMTRGPLIIRGDRIVMRQDDQGFYYGTAFGEPAFFSQKREDAGDLVEGYGERLEYDGRRDTVSFVGKASLRRLEGGRVVDEVHGARIVYDSASEFFSVEGGTGAATPANPSGRVRAVLQPRNANGSGDKTESPKR